MSSVIEDMTPLNFIGSNLDDLTYKGDYYISNNDKIIINTGTGTGVVCATDSLTNGTYTTLTSGTINYGYGNNNTIIYDSDWVTDEKYQPPAPEGELRVYDVDVIETRKKKAKILAKDVQSARVIAQDMYDKNEIILNDVDVKVR